MSRDLRSRYSVSHFQQVPRSLRCWKGNKVRGGGLTCTCDFDVFSNLTALLSAPLWKGRWEAEACGRRAELGGQRRCQCYPRHVTEYDHVLKPFLRGAVPTLESTACTAPSLGSAPARHNTPKQNVQPPPTVSNCFLERKGVALFYLKPIENAASQYAKI